MIISIQGIRGAFHEEAARKYYSGNINIDEQMSFRHVINSVCTGIADQGVMAIENTISGTIHNNLDLIKNSGLHIVGEINIPIQQNLAVSPGTKMADLEQVESHYMAINQCREFFSKYPNIKLIDMEDTALSMRRVSERKSKRIGAIGSRLAAEYYGLEIIAPSIQANKQNFTRFLMLSKSETSDLNHNKATLQVILSNEQGALLKVLNCMNDCHIDLSKIESMPLIGQPWIYQFYMDVIYETSAHFDAMINRLNLVSKSVKVMGKYRKHLSPILENSQLN